MLQNTLSPKPASVLLVPSHAGPVIKCFYYLPAQHTTSWSVVPQLADRSSVEKNWKIIVTVIITSVIIIAYI